MKDKNIRIHLIIEGLVQGVCFRANTCRKALSMGLTGWVRNLPDGTVEVVVEGPEHKVMELVSWCHQGPSGAHVTRVYEEEEEWRGEFSSFNIRY